MIMFSARQIAAALLAVVLCIAVSDVQAAKHGATLHAKHSVVKNGKGAHKKKHRRRRPVGPRLYSGVPLKILSGKTTTIATGVTYTLQTVSQKNQWRVGIVHAKLTEGYRVGLFKARDRAVGFERVEELVHHLDSAQGAVSVAAVNANYWRAGVGTAIGAAICGGEVVSFDNIKTWTRLEISRAGTFRIAPDSLAGWVTTAHGEQLFFKGANCRTADSGIVFYNHFFGPTLPPFDTANAADSLRARLMQDSAELFYETDEDIITLPDSLVLKPHSEEHTLKCMAIAIDTPRINAPWRCHITAMTQKLVPILHNGIALSFPRADSLQYRKLRTGDTITVQFQAGDGEGGDIESMLMAGPRLVRNGKVSVETAEENFHRKSFIAGGHARTAIGINDDQDEVFLVVVDRPAGTRKSGRPGIGLSDLARIMVSAGVYDGMNFDGGSSTTLVVNGQTVFPDTGVEFSRHVASAIAIVRKKVRN